MTEPAHDAEHVQRVRRMARRLGAREGAALDLLDAAALLHDLGRADAEPGQTHVERSEEIAGDLLAGAGFSEPERDAILHAIRAHSFSRGVPPHSLEARLLRDADRLDALGAIGIARTFAHGGTFYDPDDPMARRKPEPEGSQYCVEHFHEKLFKLADGLFSDEAREIARERIAFMQTFLHQLEREAAGEA